MKSVVSLLVALSLIGGPAFAHSWRDNHGDHYGRYGHHERYDRDDHHHRHHYRSRRHHYHWRRGERVRGYHYEHVDWRYHHLRRPPRGYDWVRADDGEFLLVAISTGIVASIILNSR